MYRNSTEIENMYPLFRASQMALAKNVPAVSEMQEAWVNPWVGKIPWRRAQQRDGNGKPKVYMRSNSFSTSIYFCFYNPIDFN